MKLLFIILVACLMAAASCGETHMDSPIQLCGRALAEAVNRVCRLGELDYFSTEHAQINYQHKYQEVHNWKGHAMKRDTSHSLVKMCCIKSCLVKDFIKYCTKM